ncbi:energy transducer TonB [Paraburkholderia hospita]|uniref:energy transducer TonB n=1 Tax=Paraburkholderia hospita TaxID=169430 RepID=UPI0009CE2ED4|nr:energy transducer TonB [Paraburkholderia hospita]SKC74373.1 TonB family C-terminal domain-containing protein [Paraburkholderia hospita]
MMEATSSSISLTSSGTRLDDEDARARRRWAMSLAIVLLLHAGPVVLAAWWLDPALVASAPQPSAVMIELAPLPTAPPAPPTEIPPGPKQEHVKPAKPAHPVEKVPLPQVRKAAVALPENPSPPQPRHPDEGRTPVRQTTTAPPTTAAAPAAAAALPASPVASMNAPSWQALLLGRLQQFKRYPADAQARNQQGVAYLRFTMDRKGRVLTFQLEKTSGYTLLDEEALALIQHAQPLPAPPPSVAGDPLELVVPIEFFLKDRP